MGLDRAPFRKGIPDIKLPQSRDTRIERQRTDLAPGQPVSQMRAFRRDIPIAVSADLDAELGDWVRTALNGQADDLDSVELLAIAPREELPVPARERLQIRKGQANGLDPARVRPLAKAMTDPQANRIRDDVYLALPEGPVKELIAG